MKKAVIGLIFLSLTVVLCGCTALTSESHRYLIASIGFDKKGDNIIVTAESVAINSEDDAGKRRVLLKGEGESPKDAMLDAEKKATQPFNLSHCGVIVLGENLEYADFDEICEYLYDTDEITFSVYMLSAKNAEKLLEKAPVSSVAAGYDLMSIINKETEQSGRDFKNSLYEVVAQKNRKNGRVELPYFALSGEYRVFEGLVVYENS